MEQIGDLTLIEYLGKGSFGKVYLSQRKGRKEFFATKKIERSIADNLNFKKFFNNELNILKTLNHPNIVKYEDLLASENYYYIIMEYINGGRLSDCLKKYIEIYKTAFPEEIVQYLMKQIIYALNYIHKKKIIHRDIKLDNIMVLFDTRSDKENLNMIKATIKIIDFGSATRLLAEKNYETYTAIGTFINMAPTILKKFISNEDKNKGYYEKCDIWSIGTVCYELLIGKNLYNVNSREELMEKMNKGDYELPINVSKEIVCFLIQILQYDSKKRINSDQLLKHPFLTKNFKYFEKMKIDEAKKLLKLSINNNRFSLNSKNEEKNINININIQEENNLSICPIPEESIEKKQNGNNINGFKSKEDNKNENISNNYNNINMILNKNDYNKKIIRNYSSNNLVVFYGQKISPNAILSTTNKKPIIGNRVKIPIPPKRIPQQQKIKGPAFSKGMPYYFARNLTPHKNVRSNSSKNLNRYYIIKI